MIELKHGAPPPALIDFLVCYTPTVADFNSKDFHPVKQEVKAALNQEQGGLCAYCEKPLPPTEGQIDHIKPKSGTNARPDLCFTYSNYAHSCIHPKTCGQKKQDGLLPIEPGPGCNAEWALSTDGTIEPIPSLNRQRRHAVTQTRDMLGLNRDSNLVDERKRWLASALDVSCQAPDALPQFLQSAPYRHILATVLKHLL